jgi:hypothetical protein
MPFLDFPLLIYGEEYKVMRSSLCNFLKSPIISSIFGPNILLSTLFSDNFLMCYALKVRDQDSYPYNTA